MNRHLSIWINLRAVYAFVEIKYLWDFLFKADLKFKRLRWLLYLFDQTFFTIQRNLCLDVFFSFIILWKLFCWCWCWCCCLFVKCWTFQLHWCGAILYLYIFLTQDLFATTIINLIFHGLISYFEEIILKFFGKSTASKMDASFDWCL